MNVTLFIFASLLLQMLCFWVGKKSSSNIQTQQDYYLAGKTVKFFPLMMTFLATQVGGGLILGSAEEAYKYGWYVIFFPLGSALGLFLLASGIGKKMAQYNVSTVAQLFEVIYSSPLLKKFASLLSIVSLFMIFIAQITASKKFMISIGANNDWAFAAFWSIVILYTVLGGFRAVVSTDIVQATFFILIFFFAFGFVFIKVPEAFQSTQSFTMENFDYTKLVGWLLMPLLFMVIEQDMAQRCFAAKTPQIVARSAGLAAGLTCLICLIPIFLGILAKETEIAIPEGGSVLITILQAITNPTIAALVGCAVLAAIISTADSLINAISSNISQDFEIAAFKDGQSVKAAQIITACIALCGIAVSPFFGNVVDLLVFSYELCVVCLFVPIFFGIMRKTPGHSISAYSSILAGGLSLILVKQLGSFLVPKEVMCLGASLTGYWISEGSLALKRQLATN